MSYRDPNAALSARRNAIAEHLARARAAAGDPGVGARGSSAQTPQESREVRARRARIAVLERKLAVAEALLAGSDPPPGLLDAVTIASPCRASWDEDMVGDDRVRFCGQCGKNVYNLSAMAREEAEELLLEREASEGRMCVRLFRRTDGTVLTSDCPDGVSRKRRRLALVSAVGGGLLAAGAVLQTQLRQDQGAVRPMPQPVAQHAESTMGAVPQFFVEGENVPPQFPPDEVGRRGAPPPLRGHWIGGAPRPYPRPKDPGPKASPKPAAPAPPAAPVMGDVDLGQRL